MLDRLPIECVALIVRNSPLQTLMHCTATCQACHAVAALDDVWRDLFHRTAGEQVATDWRAAQRLPTEPPLGYRAAFRAYCLSGSPIVVQLEPTRTLVGFAKEGVSNVRVLECGVRSNGVLVPGRFEAMGQALLGVLGLHTLHSMSVCVLVVLIFLYNVYSLNGRYRNQTRSQARPAARRAAKTGQHGDEQGCGNEDAQRPRALEIRSEEHEEAEKQNNACVHHRDPGFADCEQHGFPHVPAVQVKLLAVFGQQVNGVIH